GGGGGGGVGGRGVVWGGASAGARGGGVGGRPSHDPSLVSRVAPRGPDSAEGGRARRPQAAAHALAVGRSGSRAAERPRGPRLRDRPVDLAADRRGDRAADGRAVPPGACLAHPARVEVVAATARPPSARAGRGRHSPVAPPALAAGKKNARRRHAWIVFEDESRSE